MLRGSSLIYHVIEALSTECATVVVIGRDWPDGIALSDRPGPGLGPLAGLAAALHHARDQGFTAVLTAGCDLPLLPAGLAARLTPAPAHALGQPALGLWPASLAEALDDHLAAGGRSLYGWAAATGARAVDLGALANINTPADLLAAAELAANGGTGLPGGH